MTSREETCERKENAHCRIFWGGFVHCRIFWEVLFILPKWFSAMGSSSMSHKVRALPRQALKLKLVQMFGFWGFLGVFFRGGQHKLPFCDLFALKQRYWNTSHCPWRQFRLHSLISSEKPGKKRQFVHSAYLRNENELIWRVTAPCLWNDGFEEPGTGKSGLNWAQVNFSMFFTATGRKPLC